MRYNKTFLGTSLLALSLAPALANADVPRVVTEFSVTQSLVAMVMGDLGTPDVLLDAGADAHHFQLRPSHARALSQAGLVVWISDELTPWIERAVDGLAEGARLELIEVAGTHVQPYLDAAIDEGGHDHGHDDHGHNHHDHDHGHDHGHEHGHSHDNAHSDDHGHDHSDSHDHGHSHGHDHGHSHGHDHDHSHGHDHGHDHGHSHDHDHSHGHDHNHDHGHSHDHAHHHGDVDPHAWLNPENAIAWLGAIAETLASQDPANAQTYHANATAAVAEITALDAELRATLAPVGDAGLVMYHDAYGYLAARYGLNILGTIALGSAADPGAQRLAELRAILQNAGAVCIFPEIQHPDAYVTLVSEGSSTRIGAPLDPEGAMLAPGADLYPTLMRGLAQAIAECVAG